MSMDAELVSFPIGEPPPPFNPETFDDFEWAANEPRGPRTSGSKAADGARREIDRPDVQRVDVRLYVSADSLSCARAIVALEQIRRIFSVDSLSLRILDVAAHIEAATEDRVLFTPTLLMRDNAGRATRVLGDLSNSDLLVDLLRAAGIEPT